MIITTSNNNCTFNSLCVLFSIRVFFGIRGGRRYIFGVLIDPIIDSTFSSLISYQIYCIACSYYMYVRHLVIASPTMDMLPHYRRNKRSTEISTNHIFKNKAWSGHFIPFWN